MAVAEEVPRSLFDDNGQRADDGLEEASGAVEKTVDITYMPQAPGCSGSPTGVYSPFRNGGSEGAMIRQAQKDATDRQEMARLKTIVPRPIAKVTLRNC